MGLVRFNQNPKVTDQILFDLYTPDADGCFNNDPVTFDTIKIFYISRSQTQIKDLVTKDVSYNFDIEKDLFIANQDLCTDPTDPIFIRQQSKAQELLAASTKSYPTYYSQASTVFCVGDGCMSNTCISALPSNLTRIKAKILDNDHGFSFKNDSVGATQNVEAIFGVACNAIPIRVTASNACGTGGVIKIIITLSGTPTTYLVNDGSSYDSTFSMNDGDEIAITKNVNGPTWAANTMTGEIKIGTCADAKCITGWYQPAWTRGGDNTYAVIKKVTDDNDFPYGHFRLIWIPDIVKEGDYYICYTYTPNTGGNSLSKYIKFYLSANIQNEIAIPTHSTPKNKYNTLLNAYTPEMYKSSYAVDDKSVPTINNLNASIASGFTDIEDQAARLIDILDANATPEPYLGFLAKMFGIKLRSNDITRWRGQIITAVPQFKRKGTYSCLVQALSQAGIKLNKFNQYWQIGTEYTYTENFIFTGSYSFDLKNISLPIATQTLSGNTINVFELFLRNASPNDTGYNTKSLGIISIATIDGISTMTWDSSIQKLTIGDSIKITYQTKLLPDYDEYQLYVYWRDYLLLQDSRDELTQLYPPKNWNIRLITQDDSLFNIFIPIANPFQPQIVFGKVRTMFPYSENIYNMDEYNGSLRDSNDPRDMDKSFLEPCSGFISSHFGIDVEIDDLSTFRENEFKEIIEDYIPYHAVLRNYSVSNNIEEFVMPPVEYIECVMYYNQLENFISGTGQNVFARDILTLPSNFDPNTRTPQPVSAYNVFRDDLADYLSILDQGTTTFYNDYLQVIVNANTAQTNNGQVISSNFEDLGLSLDPSSAIMEIIGSSPLVGLYNVEKPFKNGFGVVAGQVSEPATLSDFSFILSNKVGSGTFTIQDASDFVITDDSVDYSQFNIRSQFDVNESFATAAWKVTIGGNTYDILKVNNDSIYLVNDGTLSTSSSTGLSYTIKNSSSVTVKSSTNGIYNVYKKAKILATAPLCSSLPDLVIMTSSPNVYYFNGTTQYKFIEMVDGLSVGTVGIIVANMTAPFTATTQSGTIYNRLLEETVGRFKFGGMKITRQASMPEMIKSLDRITRDQLIPEEFIVTLNFSGTEIDYYLNLKDDEYDPSTSSFIHIDGKFMTSGVTTGTSVGYKFKQFAPKSKVYIRANQNYVYYIDRQGQDVMTDNTGNVGFPFYLDSTNLTDQNNNGTPISTVVAKDNVSYIIKYKDGTQESKEVK